MTDVTPELLARLREAAAKWPTVVVEREVVVALVAEVERLRGALAWIASDAPWEGSDDPEDVMSERARRALQGTQEAATAPLSAEQGASGQGRPPRRVRGVDRAGDDRRGAGVGRVSGFTWHPFWRLLIRAKVPAPIYYWLLDRLTDNDGWRPLFYREGRR